MSSTGSQGVSVGLFSDRFGHQLGNVLSCYGPLVVRCASRVPRPSRFSGRFDAHRSAEQIVSATRLPTGPAQLVPRQSRRRLSFPPCGSRVPIRVGRNGRGRSSGPPKRWSRTCPVGPQDYHDQRCDDAVIIDALAVLVLPLASLTSGRPCRMVVPPSIIFAGRPWRRRSTSVYRFETINGTIASLSVPLPNAFRASEPKVGAARIAIYL
jgi:hypothetical protein